jgi:hypothetical protein
MTGEEVKRIKKKAYSVYILEGNRETLKATLYLSLSLSHNSQFTIQRIIMKKQPLDTTS